MKIDIKQLAYNQRQSLINAISLQVLSPSEAIQEFRGYTKALRDICGTPPKDFMVSNKDFIDFVTRTFDDEGNFI